MNPNPIETLSAFLDGEASDPKQLAEALSAPGAREALKDFALIRSELLADADRPSPTFYQTMNRMLQAPVPRRPWWLAAVPVPAPALAAAAVLVVVMGVWAWRASSVSGANRSELPPAPDRIVEFQPDVDWKPLGPPPQSNSDEERPR